MKRLLLFLILFAATTAIAGTNEIKGKLNANGETLNNVADPVTAQDAATKNYVDGHSATPGGSDTQVQYNSSNTFSGSANLTFDGTNLNTGGVYQVQGNPALHWGGRLDIGNDGTTYVNRIEITGSNDGGNTVYGLNVAGNSVDEFTNNMDLILDDATNSLRLLGYVGAAPTFYFASSSRSNLIGLKAPNSITPYDMTLPSAQGVADSLLQNDGSGNLTFKATPNSEIKISAPTGYGSAGTQTRTYTSAVINNGNSDLQYQFDATNGHSIKILKPGMYSISFSDGETSASDCYIGVFKNTTNAERALNFSSISTGTLLGASTTAQNITGYANTVSLGEKYLSANDVITLQIDTSIGGHACNFTNGYSFLDVVKAY